MYFFVVELRKILKREKKEEEEGTDFNVHMWALGVHVLLRDVSHYIVWHG